MAKKGIPDRFLMTVNTVILLVFALLCIYPFYYIFINSLSSQKEILKGVYMIPREITLNNYQHIFSNAEIYQAAFISVSRAVVGTLITIFCSSILAYMVTRDDLIFRKAIYRITVLSMYFNAGLIPWYMLMKNIGLKNNFLLYVLPGAVNAFFIILVKTYIESIPKSFTEAAEIDGAGILTVFLKVIFPLCIPIIATIAVFSAVGQWNSWSDNYFLAPSKHLKTLQLVLKDTLQTLNSITGSPSSSSAVQNMDNAKRISPLSIRMTMTMVTVLPIILVYPSLQRFFVKGIMLGAIKG